MPNIPARYAHQDMSLMFMMGTPLVFDMSDAGTGKTRSQIDVLGVRPDCGRTLVIAPKAILTPAWAKDFNKFAPDISVSVASAANRAEAFAAKTDVVITNTDAVTWIAKQPAKLLAGFNTCVIDESEHFKHRTSQRSKAMQKVISGMKYRSLLSATPSDNGVLDLWHQAYLLDNGATLGKNFFAFRQQACTPKQVGPMPNHLDWVDKEGVEGMVALLLKDYTIRHKLEECLSIPPNTTIVVEFDLTPPMAKAYNQMHKLGLAMLADGTLFEAVNGAAVSTKLRQLASGAAYKPPSTGDPNEELSAFVDTARYELAVELALQAPQSVIFFEWKHQKKGLMQVLESRKIEYGVVDGSTSDKVRNQYVDRYQNGELRTMLVHPLSGAHGLTLTRGTRTVWATPHYKGSTARQGLGRIYRSGQDKATDNVVIIAKGTIDEQVYAAQTRKTGHQASLLEILMDYFNGA